MKTEHSRSNLDIDRVLSAESLEEAQQLRAVWEALGGVSEANLTSSSEASALFERIEKSITQPAKSVQSVRLVWLKYASIAASLVVFTMFGWAWSPKSIEALPGEQISYAFPDGSTVFLNSGSSVEHRKWIFWSRDVRLSGEGFFEVESGLGDFSVSTSNAEITVLGTKFNISSPREHDGNSTALTVSEGKVRFRPLLSDLSVVVETGHFSEVFDGASRATSPQDIQEDVNLEWMQGDLIFRNTSFDHAVAESARRLGIQKVVLPPDVGTVQVTLAFRAPLSQEAVLTGLTMPLGLHYRETKDGIEIFR